MRARQHVRSAILMERACSRDARNNKCTVCEKFRHWQPWLPIKTFPSIFYLEKKFSIITGPIETSVGRYSSVQVQAGGANASSMQQSVSSFNTLWERRGGSCQRVHCTIHASIRIVCDCRVWVWKLTQINRSRHARTHVEAHEHKCK